MNGDNGGDYDPGFYDAYINVEVPTADPLADYRAGERADYPLFPGDEGSLSDVLRDRAAGIPSPSMPSPGIFESVGRTVADVINGVTGAVSGIFQARNWGRAMASGPIVGGTPSRSVPLVSAGIPTNIWLWVAIIVGAFAFLMMARRGA